MSVLEGGYNTNLGPLSPLGLSVKSHVRALIHSRNKYSGHDANLSLLGKRSRVPLLDGGAPMDSSFSDAAQEDHFDLGEGEELELEEGFGEDEQEEMQD